MFQNLMDNKVFAIDISLDEILRPYWDLMITLSPNKTDVIKRLELSNIDTDLNSEIHKKIADLESNKAAQNITPADFDNEIDAIALNIFTRISIYLTESLFQVELMDKHIKNTSPLAIKGSQYSFYIYENKIDKFKEDFVKLLSKIDPIKQFLSCIFKDIISKEIIKSMYSQDLYKIVVKWENANTIDIESVFYSYELCTKDNHLITLEVVTNNLYWLNSTFLEKLEIHRDEVSFERVIVTEGDNKINVGYKLNNYFIPYLPNWKNYLKINNKTIFFWENIKNNIYRKIKSEQEINTERNITKIKKRVLIEQFSKDVKKEAFASLLSQLEDNLYLEEKPNADFDKYFDLLIVHENLDRFENFRFLTANSQNKDTILGIYKIRKEHKETSFNLMHYITDNDAKKTCWRSIDVYNNSEKKIVYALKPDIAYYYISEYFEDFFKDILNKLKEEKNIDYVTNYKIICGDKTSNEIDAIVYLNNKIYFIELKTNLSIDYIRSYQAKCNKWMRELSEIKDNIEFIIIGAQAKEELYIFNGDLDKDDPQRVMKVYPYSFNVPLEENKKLKCLTEPSFDRLTQKLVKIFQ